MSDIDFLANKKPADDREPKKRDDKEEKIIWSEPDKDKPLVKEAPFSWLPFFSKKKADKKPASTAGEPAAELSSAVYKSGAIPGKAPDKNKIIKSRREILELIKHNESSEQKEKKKPSESLFAGWIEKFKKQPNHKEVLIDYQQIFNQEKIKRSSSARPAEAPAGRPASPNFQRGEQTGPSKPAAPPALARPVSKVLPVAEKNPPTIKPVKEHRDSFLSRFLKMIKNKMAASNRPKLRPAKINLAETTPLVPLNEVMEVKSAGEEKSKIEIKKELLKPVEPAKIEEKPLKVIETNLIKGEIITFIDWHKKIVVLINVVLIPIFLIAVIYIGLMSYQKQSQAKIQEQTKKFNELTEKIKQAEVGLKDITEFQTRLGIVSKVFAKHIYWTNFFRFLEDNTIKDVYYSGFGGDTGGKYSLDAVASTFSNISEQVDILRNNHKITDVQTSGGQFIPGDGANKTKVKFTLDLSILKDIFTE